MDKRDQSCETRIDEAWASTKEALETLWKAYCDGVDETEGYGSIYDYGLSFDYVAPGTFDDQKEGYWRYQLSWGGPSDELRFFASSPQSPAYRIEYWFLDWFDGASRNITDEEIANEYWNWFQEIGSTDSAFKQAMSE